MYLAPTEIFFWIRHCVGRHIRTYDMCSLLNKVQPRDEMTKLDYIGCNIFAIYASCKKGTCRWTDPAIEGKKMEKKWKLLCAQELNTPFAMESVFPNQPADCLFKTSLFIQQWWPLFRNKDLEAISILEELLRQLYQHSYTPPWL
jgi:hypothetical protein